VKTDQPDNELSRNSHVQNSDGEKSVHPKNPDEDLGSLIGRILQEQLGTLKTELTNSLKTELTHSIVVSIAGRMDAMEQATRDLSAQFAELKGELREMKRTLSYIEVDAGIGREAASRRYETGRYRTLERDGSNKGPETVPFRRNHLGDFSVRKLAPGRWG